MRSLKLSLPLLLLALLSLYMTTCQSATPPTVVSFMISGDPAERQAYLDLVAAFEKEHPDIHIELTHIPSDSDYRKRLSTDFAAGTPPDVSLMNYRRVASFIEADQLEPIGPYLDKSDIIQPDMFFDVSLEAFTWNGTLTCMPQNISSLAVYYNQDLFAAAGLPYPADDWTWDEFVTTAVSLTRDLDGNGSIDQYGLGIEPILYRLAPFVWQNRAPLVDDLKTPTRLTLTRPPALAALQWFVDLHQVHGVVPDRVAEASLDSESRFIGGTTAMFINSRRSVPTFREITAFTWDVAPLPQGQTTANILHSDAYCLSKATTNKEAAWTFIEFANSPAGQTVVAGSGRTVPSLISVANSPAYLDPTKPPSRSAVWLDSAPYLQRVPVISTWVEIENTAGEEIERAFYGDITAAEAARLAVQRTEEYFLLAQQN